MAQDDLGRRGIIVGRQRPEYRAAYGRVFDETMQIGQQARARAALPGRIGPSASYRAVFRDLERFPAGPTVALGSRGQGPAEGPVPRRPRSGRARSPASASGQPSGRATCLRPRRASWVPIKRSTHALSSDAVEHRDDGGQAGPGVCLHGPPGHEPAHDRNLAARAASATARR